MAPHNAVGAHSVVADVQPNRKHLKFISANRFRPKDISTNYIGRFLFDSFIESLAEGRFLLRR